MKKIFQEENTPFKYNPGKIIIFSWILFSISFLLINYFELGEQETMLTMSSEKQNLKNYQQRIKELSSINPDPDEKTKNIIIKTANNNNKIYYIKNEILFHNSNLSQYEASYRALYIYNTAQELNIDPYLITAIGTVESNHKHNSVSHKGAVGVLQLTPTVERIYNVNAEIFEENVQGGAEFIRDLHQQYDDLELALAHYNGGSRPYYKVENYEETQSYVTKVQNIYNSMKQRYEIHSEKTNNEEKNNNEDNN
ncbi:MAG: lytic transglycosylase domain-containing protein [bacterium]